MKLQHAVFWVQAKEPVAASLGAHLALTGSTIFKGESQKDTDIICYPHDPKVPFDKKALATALWLVITNVDDFEAYANKDYGRCVAICQDNDTGSRFDLFFMQ
jgi:hypothetical protein